MRRTAQVLACVLVAEAFVRAMMVAIVPAYVERP
jgi:hypothetical protein